MGTFCCNVKELGILWMTKEELQSWCCYWEKQNDHLENSMHLDDISFLNDATLRDNSLNKLEAKEGEDKLVVKLLMYMLSLSSESQTASSFRIDESMFSHLRLVLNPTTPYYPYFLWKLYSEVYSSIIQEEDTTESKEDENNVHIDNVKIMKDKSEKSSTIGLEIRTKMIKILEHIQIRQTLYIMASENLKSTSSTLRSEQ